VTDLAAEARIRDLRRRISRDAKSPLFIGLAEEYRGAGRTAEAIRTLEKGIQVHPNYISARVALGRAYLEAGRTADAEAQFTGVLALDPGNLVAARSVAEILRARGDRAEALKRYELYRALSGDRGVDGLIEEIRAESERVPAGAEPAGRVLADLYLEQGHNAEALAIYEDLCRSSPDDPEIARRRDEAASRLPSEHREGAVSLPSERREVRIQALKRWLSVIKTG